MRRLQLFLGLVLLASVQGCGVPALDQSDPRKVVQRLFDAAKADDPRMLEGLCEPDHQSDSDTKCICALAPDYVADPNMNYDRCRLTWDQFKTQFEKGSLIDQDLEPQHGEVPFYYGQNGRRKGMMLLNYQGGKWYLHAAL